MKTLTLLLALALIATSCSKKDDDVFAIDGLSPIIQTTEYSSLSPGKIYDFFMVRGYSCGREEDFASRYTFGSIGNVELPKPVNGVIFDTKEVCYKTEIVSIKDNTIQTYETLAEIITFLGTINSPSDALLMASLNGYFFKYNDSSTGIKQMNGKYYIIAFKNVSFCSPMQNNRFLLEVDIDGSITIVAEKIEYKDNGGLCI